MKKLFGFLKNNKGVSLMEMVVVIAIMSVIVGAVSIGIGMVSTKPVDQCASNMEISLNRCRTQTMGKKSGFIAFYAETDGSITMVEKLDFSNYDLADDSDCGPKNYVKKTIGKKGISVVCGGVDLVANPGVPVIFEFNRSDGSLKTPANPEIIVSKGSRKTITVKVQKLTGKVVLTKG